MGLLVSIYRSSDVGDCTNNGISKNARGLCLINVPGPFEPSQSYPAAILQRHPSLKHILRIVPANIEPFSHSMMGGNYAATSDSRFREMCETLAGVPFYGAVAIHDRLE